MKNNLLTRFLVIIGVAIIACWITWASWPPLLGIDLAGGTSLVYELDLSKVPKGNNEGNMELAERVVEVLKKRVDPLGQKNIIWRVLEQGKRIQIQMPYAPKVTRDAKAHEEELFKKLQEVSWKQSEILAAVGKKGADREAALDKFAAKGSEQRAKLDAFAQAADRFEAANAAVNKEATEATLGEQLAAKKDYNQKLQEAMQQSVDPASLFRVVANADDSENTGAREELAELPARYPLQKNAIEAYIQAHQELMKLNGGGVSDSAELKRLVTKAGVLDFRIALVNKEVAEVDRQEATRVLTQKGPDQQVDAAGSKARWFQVGATSNLNNAESDNPEGYIIRHSSGVNYILCYDDHDHALTHTDPKRKSWSVTANTPYNDPSQGGLVLPFKLDPQGGSYMGDLTGLNTHHPMAILLDDVAMSAPNINSQINDNGVITFGNQGSALKEAEQLKQIMDAGSLPATLRPDPISEENISSDMGADNITAGIHSSIIAVIAVMLFMVAYYTITGMFANLALMLNLALVLATMSVIRGTFTLPGIAGLVLTLGMAVDANVLINERIREEIHRGASLWMAIKQGYDKVFWTIFDANLTTSLTSIVLIYVGSEEVKGFGVTLLIGLCIHMFTALFVTRTLMMGAVKLGILRAIDDHSIAEYLRELFTFTWLRNGHFPFMRVITVTKIDWIGKRHIFWWVSAVVMFLGLAAFVARGEDKYDIEFRGGTQVTFQLKDPAGDVLRSMMALGSNTEVRKAHPELDPVALDKLRDLPVEKRNEKIKELAAGLEGNAAFVQAHPEVKEYGPKLAVTQTTLTLDKVRHMIEGLAAQPGLQELSNARVYTIGKQGDNRFQLQTTIANVAASGKNPGVKVDTVLLEPLASTFKDYLDIKPKMKVKNGDVEDVKELMDKGYIEPIKETQGTLEEVFTGTEFSNMPARDVSSFKKGVAIVLDDISSATPINAEDLTARIRTIRQSSDFSSVPNRNFAVMPITVLDAQGKAVPAADDDTRPLVRAVVVTVDSAHPYDDTNDNLMSQWRSKVVATEWQIIQKSLAMENLFEGVTSFDAVVASQAKLQALIAIVISLVLIVVYVWVRFGGLLYGLGAILSLAHDAIVALAATVLSGVAYNYLFGRHPFLLITDFKINLTMIAAYLTVIGYSVNDTIVIFDRVRELRGKSRTPLSATLINDAINQCFGRTIWTTFTVFIVVLIMYVWGGEGVRGFSFAMLIGVITGAYSTLAIASPMLLATGAGKGGPSGPSPFVRKVQPQTVPELMEGDVVDVEHEDGTEDEDDGEKRR